MPSNHTPNPAFNPANPPSATNPTTVANNPTQAAVNAIFPAGACPNPHPTTGCIISPNLLASRFSTNRDGTVFGGLPGGAFGAPIGMTPGAYRFNGPVFNHPTNPRSGDWDGDFQGLPVFVQMPNGQIKENSLYNWTSIPLERLSGFANGHFDLTDTVRVTAQAMVTRTKTETSLGLAAANINQWGAGIPFGTALYRGNSNTYFDIPDSLCTAVGPGCTAVGVTNQRYTPTGHVRRPVRRSGHGRDALARQSARLHELGGVAGRPRGLQFDDARGRASTTSVGEPRAGLDEITRSAPAARRTTSRRR